MRILVALLAFLCLMPFVAGPASAAIPLVDKLCTFDSELSDDFDGILPLTHKFDCSDTKLVVEGPRIWVKIPFRADSLADGPVELQGDNNGLTEMAIFAVSNDDSVQSRFYSAQEVIDSWRPKGRYALIVPGSDTPAGRDAIRDVYVAIDNPKVISSISLMQLASTAVMGNQQLPLSVMFAVLCGMLIMPFIYNAFFYGAMRYSFMLWHGVLVIASTAYTFGSSGILFIAFPETSLMTKMLINYWSIAIAIFASGLFFIKFVEDGKITKRLQAAILMTGFIPIIVTAVIVQPGADFDMNARNYYHASYLPYFITIIYTMVQAVRKGSVSVRFQLVAWSPIALFGFDRIARGMDLYIGIPALDYGLYFMLVFENIVMALGVAHRIMRLRRQHEKTLRKQVELTLLAETDGLTAIGNRRAFEKAFIVNMNERRYSHLAILDIDFFKRVNDLYGHEVGDDVLRIVGSELGKTRHFVARIGGEEFALLVKSDSRQNRKKNPATELTRICETLIKAVHNGVPAIKQPVTFSVGITDIPKRTSLRSVMSIADKRLYNAKNNGRNQVVSFDISNLKPDSGSGTAVA